MKIHEINVETGEVILRDASDSELENSKKVQNELNELRVTSDKRKEIAFSKLEMLGLTKEDLVALGL